MKRYQNLQTDNRRPLPYPTDSTMVISKMPKRLQSLTASSGAEFLVLSLPLRNSDTLATESNKIVKPGEIRLPF